MAARWRCQSSAQAWLGAVLRETRREPHEYLESMQTLTAETPEAFIRATGLDANNLSAEAARLLEEFVRETTVSRS